MMREMRLILILFLGFFIASCSGRTAMVGADKNTSTDANLGDYKTFAFASQVDSKLDEGFYFLNDLVLKAKLREAVSYEMESRGYKMADQDADLVINFRVFDKPAEITGWTGVSTEAPYWGDLAVKEPEDRRTYNLDAGSVIIHLVDKKTGNLLWQGYASGIMDGNVLTKDENKIKEAVSLIFDKYDQRADDLGGISR